MGAWAGGQSVCYDLQSPKGAFVLKVFSPAHAFNTDATSRIEYDALRRLEAALPSDGTFFAPQPLVLCEPNPALLMTFVEGQDLDAWFGRLLHRGSDLDSLAATILSALAQYHDIVGAEFGDFHPGNILVRDSRHIVFLDPTSPDPLIASMANDGVSKMALDLGYWASSVALNWPLEARTMAYHPFNRLRLTRRLIDGALDALSATERAAFVESTFAVAHAHVRRLRVTGSPKEKLLALVSFVTLAGLARGLQA